MTDTSNWSEATWALMKIYYDCHDHNFTYEEYHAEVKRRWREYLTCGSVVPDTDLEQT